MGLLIEMGWFLFIMLPIGAWITFYLWIMYKSTKADIMKTEVTNAYFLKRIRQQVEERKIDFDEMMQEYHESVKIWKQKFSEKGVLDQIDESIDGELEEPSKKK